jgi:hypothetical protein
MLEKLFLKNTKYEDDDYDRMKSLRDDVSMFRDEIDLKLQKLYFVAHHSSYTPGLTLGKVSSVAAVELLNLIQNEETINLLKRVALENIDYVKKQINDKYSFFNSEHEKNSSILNQLINKGE